VPTRDHLTGVLLGLSVVGAAMLVHHGTPVVDTRRAALVPVSNDPGIDLVDGGRLAVNRPVPVRTAPFAASDFRCRWAGSAVPVVPTSFVRGHCSVPVRPAVGSRITVRLVRVDATGAVVEEYRPVTVRWTAPDPEDD
jgi:hypothetical protein